jgi:hypothetical protein
MSPSGVEKRPGIIYDRIIFSSTESSSRNNALLEQDILIMYGIRQVISDLTDDYVRIP